MADVPLLTLQDVSARHGRQPALHGISLQLRRGESLAIAGSNGAGKTTLLSLIAGAGVAGRAASGSLVFEGRARALAAAPAIEHGIALVPERGKVFTLLSVEENLRLGRRGGGLSTDDVYTWFPRLQVRRQALAGNLSGGEQQMLGVALALMSNPRLLLLDEPMLGLAVPVIEDLCERLARLRRDLGLTLLVAESDSQWLPALADRALVLAYGRLVGAAGTLGPQKLNEIHDIMLGLNHAAGLAAEAAP
ncbi:MAG: ATP-binding cassette domain-containing protein [Achromobacter sp.]